MKKFYLFVLLMLATVSLQAQEQKGNWYFGANAGAQVFDGKEDDLEDLSSRLAPVGGVTVGHWFTNYLAIDANISFARFKGLSKLDEEAHFTTDDWFTASHSYQRGAYMHCHVDTKVDILYANYAPDTQRAHYLLPYIGIGVAKGLNGGGGTSLTLDLGLQYRYQIAPTWALQADVLNYWLTDGLEGEKCSRHTFHYVPSLSLGVVYTLR